MYGVVNDDSVVDVSLVCFRCVRHVVILPFLIYPTFFVVKKHWHHPARVAVLLDPASLGGNYIIYRGFSGEQ